MKYCPRCGYSNPDSGLFCCECGCSLESNTNNNSETGMPRDFGTDNENNSFQKNEKSFNFNMNTDYTGQNQNSENSQNYEEPNVANNGNYNYNSPNVNNNGYGDYNSQYNPSYQYQSNNLNDKQSSSKSIAGLVLGIISVVFSLCCCCPYISGLGAILGIVGLVLAILGKKESPYDGKSTAAIILSAIGIVLGVLITIYALYCISNASNASQSYWENFLRNYSSSPYRN